jgi:hypothetical protein
MHRVAMLALENSKPICSSGVIIINYATILATPNLKLTSADGTVGSFLTPNKKYFSLD